MIRTPADEPVMHDWRALPIAELVHAIAGRTGRARRTRPAVVVIDGRSGGGKSTLAERLQRQTPGSVVVHSDDIAWFESFFEWDRLMVDGVLRPAWRGEHVRFRPPAWERQGRGGAIEVPSSTSVLFVEGVGVSRRALGPWIDHAIWVQSDQEEARRRGIERDGDTADAAAFWDEWSAVEDPFLTDDRPWDRAEFVVCGTPSRTGVQYDAQEEVLVGRMPARDDP